MQLIIFGQQNDGHVGYILEHLKFDTVRIVNHHSTPEVSLKLYNDRYELILGGELVDLSIPSVIWYRIKHDIKRRIPQDYDPEDHMYRHESWRSFMRPLPELFEKVVVFNGGPRSVYARYKILQENAARQIGLKMPDTVFTNAASKIRELGDNVAYKVIGNRIYPKSKGMTERVSYKFLEKHAENVEQVPAIFQRYEDKNFEVRAIISRAEAAAVKIHSQSNDKSKVDWRYGQKEIEFEKFSLPIGIIKKCQELLKCFDLYIGQFDFIVSPEGEFIFLECNPEGQWLGYSRRIGASWEMIFANAINAVKARLD